MTRGNMTLVAFAMLAFNCLPSGASAQGYYVPQGCVKASPGNCWTGLVKSDDMTAQSTRRERRESGRPPGWVKGGPHGGARQNCEAEGKFRCPPGTCGRLGGRCSSTNDCSPRHC
jgi:hypothetical protein